MYLCAIKDLFKKEIDSYAMGSSQEMTLVYQALEELKKKGFVNGAILHNDQDVQFTNQRYIQRL